VSREPGRPTAEELVAVMATPVRRSLRRRLGSTIKRHRGERRPRRRLGARNRRGVRTAGSSTSPSPTPTRPTPTTPGSPLPPTTSG